MSKGMKVVRWLIESLLDIVIGPAYGWLSGESDRPRHLPTTTQLLAEDVRFEFGY